MKVPTQVYNDFHRLYILLFEPIMILIGYEGSYLSVQ